MSAFSEFYSRIIKEIIGLGVLSVIVALGVNGLRPDRLPLIGSWSPEARIVSKTGESMVISLHDAQKMFESQQAVFVDARPLSEYDFGHIRGAIGLPWSEFNVYFSKVAPDIPENKTIITYCDGESCDLSKELAQALTDLGYKNVRVLVNGWSVWDKNRLPVEKTR